MAAEAGADAIGLVFARSPRQVTLGRAREIVAALPPFVFAVGVFVNARTATVIRTVNEVGLSAAQLHGDESPAFCRKIKVPVVKAFRMKSISTLASLSKYRVIGFLLDAFDEEQFGGTGQTFNWQWARGAKRYGPVILAGGLTPANVADAVRRVQPYGVDVCSGVEESPGNKDPRKIKAFFKAVRGQ